MSIVFLIFFKVFLILLKHQHYNAFSHSFFSRAIISFCLFVLRTNEIVMIDISEASLSSVVWIKSPFSAVWGFFMLFIVYYTFHFTAQERFFGKGSTVWCFYVKSRPVCFIIIVFWFCVPFLEIIFFSRKKCIC